MKKFISAAMSLILIVSMAIPTFAADKGQISNTDRFVTSDIGYMEVTYNFKETGVKFNKDSSSKNDVESFVVEQFENNELIQKVEGNPGGSELFVTNYNAGEVVSTEIVKVSDYIVRENNTEEDSIQLEERASVGSQLGYITYNPTTNSTKSERIRVYSKQTDSDTDSFTIKAKEADTLAVVVGAVASVLSVFVAGATIARQIVVAIVSGLGGSVAGGAIGVVVSEPVATQSYYYTLTGYDYSTDRYTLGCDGVARRVLTKKSKYYDEWFYEDFTPYNWKNNTLAYWFWCDLFGDPYPKVKSYT